MRLLSAKSKGRDIPCSSRAAETATRARASILLFWSGSGEGRGGEERRGRGIPFVQVGVMRKS
jgi:hypothetical protein